MSALTDKVAGARALLERAQQHYAPVTFASSLGAEDMVLTDLIAREFPLISIFTIDTGRLPRETLQLLERVRARYRRAITVFQPENAAIAEYVCTHGLDGFYRSVELRKACCHVRKVEPLQRALAGQKAWITGLRREQSVTRSALGAVEADLQNGLMKINPLWDWSEADVWTYIHAEKLPYNSLHDRGYRSIGCAPCTRAVRPGEDVRAGRWWWEAAEKRECGLHPSARATDASEAATPAPATL